MYLGTTPAERVHRPAAGPQGLVACKGIPIPDPEVGDALAELAAFQRDFEGLFLSLAESLPTLCATIQDLSARFSRVQGDEVGVGRHIAAEVEDMVQESRSATRSVLAHSQEGLAAAGALGTAAGSLALKLTDGEQVSLKLRLAAMNASFAVHGLGTQAAAFSAVNRALIDVAEQSASLTLTMSASARSTSGAANALAERQQALATQIAQTTGATEARSRGALDACAQVLAQLGQELVAVSEHGRRVVEATGKIMVTIQHQDILRQGLDHVTLVLRALHEEFQRLARDGRPEASAMAFLRFQTRATHLTTHLIVSLREQLEGLVRAVEEPIDGLVVAAALIAGRVEDASAIERSLAAPATGLAEGFRQLPTLEEFLARCAHGVEELAEQVSALKAKVAFLEQIPLQITLVGVMMKIEIAHTEGLGGASGIAADLARVSASFRDLHRSSEETIDVFASPLQQVRVAVERQRSSWTGLRNLPASISQGAARVQERAAAFREQLGRLGQAGAELEQRTRGLHGELQGFRRSLATIDGLRQTCEGWHDEAERLEGRLAGLGLAPAEEPVALRSLIERFTLFEHKQIASGIAEVVVTPQEGQPGELTLF